MTKSKSTISSAEISKSNIGEPPPEAEKNKPGTTASRAAQDACGREAMLSAVLQSYPGGFISILDKDLHHVLAMGQGLEPLGIVAEDIPGKSFEEVYGAAEAWPVLPLLRRAAAGETVGFEIKHAGRSFASTALPMAGGDAAKGHLLVVSRDVTEERRAAEQIESPTRFPDENPHPVLRFDLDGRLLYANAGSAPLLADWNVAVGKTMPGEIVERIAEAAGKNAVLAFDVPVGDSVYNMSLAPLPDKGYVNLYALDVTARVDAENALQDSEERFRSLVENVQEGFWIRDFPADEITYANPRADAVFGFPPGTLSHDTGRIIEAIDPEDRARVEGGLDLLRKGKKPFNEEYWLTGADGKRRFVMVQSLPLLGDDGEVRRQVAMAVDLTERKTLEEGYVRACEQAQAANRSKSTFLANMSHEIRTPMNGVMGMLQLLEASGLNEEQQGYAETAMSASEKLLRIISDILDLSKVEAGKLEFEESAFDLYELVGSMENLFPKAALNKGVAMRTNVDPAVPRRIRSDEIRLRQLLFNLLGNALKFTEQGSVDLSVAVAEGAAGDGATRLRFTVADTGIGMDADLVERIFDPFTQAEGSYRRQYQGTGLGLSIVRRIIDLMDGEIRIESAKGQGTEIVFTLPVRLDTAEPEAAPDPGARAEACPEGLRVLLAEDDPLSQEACKRFLGRKGCDVRVVSNGEQALAALGEEDFDIVLMDIQMPVMDGLEATQAIRNDPALAAKSRIPVVAMTAYAQDGDEQAFLQAGMDDYVTKPVQFRKLLDVIHRSQGKN